MKRDEITLQETLQLHELMTLKSLSLTKSVVMAPLVTDPDLNMIMKKDAGVCQGHIDDLMGYMDRSMIAGNMSTAFDRRDAR